MLKFISATIPVTEGRMLVSPGLQEKKKLEIILNKHVLKNMVVVEKAERHGRPRCKLEGNIKIDLQ
jgi:hypothetical protein